MQQDETSLQVSASAAHSVELSGATVQKYSIEDDGSSQMVILQHSTQ
jgi:hypothetical protein